MSQQPPRAGFTDVDHQGDPQDYVWCLDQQHAQPFKQLYKQHALDLLDPRPGHQVLDVGCGTGQDALALAERVAPQGRVVGIDSSMTMIEEARRRTFGTHLPVTFAQEDVHWLSFEADTFDRCRADRTFQHVVDPRQALAEMIRVTRPGGRLLIVDPDHETLVIDTPYRDVTRRFLQFRGDGLRQGGVAHQLFGLFKEAGLAAVTVEAMTDVATDYEAINGVMRYDEGMRTAARYGVVTLEEAERWIAYLQEAARQGRFFSSLTYFVATGEKPA